jgi:pantoate--beta-alanine ligase
MTNAPILVHSKAQLRAHLAAWRKAGDRIGFVPTMGALHEGHLSLVDLASTNASRVVVSIFVNPIQFAPQEDLAAYPRTLDEDAALLAARPCDLIYAPNAPEIYPDGFATTISMTGPAEGLESEARPHFFAGVATVVAKLFKQIEPDLAVFGEKDFQQLQVIRRLVRDLDFAIDIIAGATARDHDGLALSSRNRRIGPDRRATAIGLFEALQLTARALESGLTVAEAEAKGRAHLVERGFDRIDYIAARAEDDLGQIRQTPARGRIRILGAAVLDDVRLIDNIAITLA